MKLVKSALAQVTNPIYKNGGKLIKDPISFINNFIQGLFTLFMLVGVLYFAWHFVMGAYHYMSTEGDKTKLETAKQELTHAFIGLIILFSVFALLKLIGFIFGIDGLDKLQLTWPSLI